MAIEQARFEASSGTIGGAPFGRVLIGGLCMILVGMLPSVGHERPSDNKAVLWYRQPAAQWEEALPLGNGRLGAMVYGGAPVERLQLNEESLWAGEPCDVYPPDFKKHLEVLRKLVLEGQYAEAQAYGLEHMTGEPTSFRSYQPLADLWFEHTHDAEVTEYRRELDLQTGFATTRYRAGDATIVREVLCSAVDDLLVMRITSDAPGAVSGTIRLSRERDANVTAIAPDRLRMEGQIVDVSKADGGHDDNPGGSGPGGAHMRFAGELQARTDGGSIAAEGNTLVVEGANAVVILFTAATDFSLDRMTFDRAIDPGALALSVLNKGAGKPWDDLRADHVREHRAMFDRVSIDLGSSAQDALPTDERLEAVKAGALDPGLTATHFQFGRYLLMNSSRAPGRLPANLQGIWNDKMWAPWESDYHLNINLQMNYWPADLCNLPETMDSLTAWFSQVTEQGRRTADILYGADGWLTFHAIDLYGRTTPSGSNRQSQFINGVLDPLAGAWMSMTLWRHYTYSMDTDFLRQQAYPVLKGATEFILDYLVEMEDGSLAIVPSTSPENFYKDPTTGAGVRITQNATYHITLARVVLEATRQAAVTLDTDPSLCGQIEEALKRIPSIPIGPDERIQEWFQAYEEVEPGHRHMSHLLGLHPFSEITPETPELMAAATKSLEMRLASGGGHTGWSRAWLINMFARLLGGGEAHRHIQLLLRKSTHTNLFDNHPPFQIDGNFGVTAGIAEMLIQSHRGFLHLLPALPPAWPDGSVTGLLARGGFEVDLFWADGRLTKAVIHSRMGTNCAVAYGQTRREFSTTTGQAYVLDGELTSLEAGP